MAQQQVLIPFEEGAKKRYVPDKILSDKLSGYVSGGTSTMALRKVGMTMGLLVKLSMTATRVSGTVAATEEGLYSLIKRIQVIIGNNQAQPIDLDSKGLRAVQRGFGMQRWFGFDTPAVGKVVPNSNYYSQDAPTAGVPKTWNFWFYVPFSVNLHQDRHLGALPTAARGFTANLQIDWETEANLTSTGVVAISNATAEVNALTLDVPDFSKVQKPRFWIFARRSTTQGHVLAGVNKVEIPQGGILLSLGTILKCNGVRSNAIDEVGFILAGNDQPMTQKLYENQANYAARHGIDLPSGEAVFDLLEDSNEGFTGSYRDTIDTTKLGLLEAFVDVSGSADLSTNPSLNSITVVRTTQHPINVAI